MTPYRLVHIARYTWSECQYVLDEGPEMGTRLNQGKFLCSAGAEVGTFVVQSLAANWFGMQFQLLVVCETVFMNE